MSTLYEKGVRSLLNCSLIQIQGLDNVLLWKFLITGITTNKYEELVRILCDDLDQQQT